jgi:hypothetical protein
MTIEHERLNNDGAAWKQWGPYLSERAWGTVREDYSAYGNAWDYFSHDHARSRAYRKVSIALRQIVRCNSGANPLVTAQADTAQAWPTTEPASRGRCGG